MTPSDTSALPLLGGGDSARPRPPGTARDSASERLQTLRRRRRTIRNWVATTAALLFASTGALIGLETHASTTAAASNTSSSSPATATQSSSSNSGSTQSSSGSSSTASGSSNSSSGSSSAVTSSQS